MWLTQAQLAILFEKDQSVIARHIKNALLEGEIDESNMQILHNTLSRYKPTTVYNLDVIISVGYRVHSKRGVQFRRWANSVPKDTTQKGMKLPALTWSPKKTIIGIVVFCFCFDRSRRLIPSVSAFSPSNLRFYISIRSFRPDYLSIRYDRGVVPP